MDPHRCERVSEAMREELSEIIGYEMGDPRLQGVTVTDVQVSPDLRHAHVRVELAGDAAQRGEALAALEGAQQYLRRQLGQRLELYRMPDLIFLGEAEISNSKRISMLRRIRKGRSKISPTGTERVEKNPT